MRRLFFYTLFLLLLACNHQQAPTSFDCKCPTERVSFKKPERLPLTTYTPDSVSMPIELTEDSSFIGMWYQTHPPHGSIVMLYSKINKLYYKFYNFNIFGDINSALSPKYVREKKIFNINGVYWFDDIYLDSITNFPSFIGENTKMLYSPGDGGLYYPSRPIDSLTQPFAERKAFIEYCEKADSNTLAWYVGGGVLVRWYKKDGVDYLMYISGLGYECEPVRLKKTWKNGYQLLSYKDKIPTPFYISNDSSSYYILTDSGKDTMSYSYRTTPEREKEENYLENYSFYDQYFFYYIFDYKGVYVPD